MSDRDRGLAGRVFDVCVGTLLAAMALYGAVEIASAIWKPLCIGLAVACVIAATIWIIAARLRRW